MRLGWNLPLERLSATSLSLLVQCPEQFRQKYIVKEAKDIMNGPRFIGIVDHMVSQRMIEAKMLAIDPNVDMIYKNCWNEVIQREGEPDWREDDPSKMIDRGVKMAELYAREVLPTINPIATEQRFEFTVPGVPAKIVGYIDIMEKYVIRERKTTAVKTTKPKSKWRFQGIIYQYATGLPVSWDVITRQATPQVFTAANHPDLFLDVMDLGVARQLITDAAIRMNDLYSRYGPDHPWPMEGMVSSDWLCDYCPIGPKYERSCLVWRT